MKFVGFQKVREMAGNQAIFDSDDVMHQLTFLLRRSFCLKTPWRLTKRN